MTNTCKVLIITDTYVGIPGGSERHLYNFLSGLSDNYTATAYQLIPSGNPMLLDGAFLNKINVRLQSHPLTKILSINYLILIYKLLAHIKSNNIDVIISYHEKSDITNYIIKNILGQRIVSISSKRDLGFKLTGRLRAVIQYITKKFDAITAPSNSIKDWLISDFMSDADKIHVIKNGVDFTNYQVTTVDQRNQNKARLNMPKTKKLMTSVACLKPIKGHEYLIQAFSEFKQSCKGDWCLVLIGDGELRSELESQAACLGVKDDVHFMGYQTNVSDWLSISDLVVSATLSEGLSNALIEGCAAGCPVIATNVGGNPEIITDGYNGLLVESKSATQLSDAMLKLAGDPELIQVMGEHSRQKALLEFSNPIMVAALEALYLQFKNSKEMKLARI